MKSKSKIFSIIFTSVIAVLGVLSLVFFSRQIIVGLKSVEVLKQEAGKAEALELAINKAKLELESTKEKREVLDSLFIVEEETEQGIVPFLDVIEADLNINNNSFDFISVEKDKKDQSIITFSGKSYGNFLEALKSFQILEREVYPIEVTKAILGKDTKNIELGGAWTASFQANILTIPKIVKEVPVKEEVKK